MCIFGFPFSSRKCTTANVCIPPSDTDRLWSLKKFFNPKPLYDCPKLNCLTPGVQSKDIYMPNIVEYIFL